MTTVHMLQGPPPSGLARALETFEQQFTYPLGPGRSFRISHGADYTRFYRAMGEVARVFVAERDGQVMGTVAAAVRPLRTPEGREQHSAYIGDLKILPAEQGGRTILRLGIAFLKEARKHSHAESRGFGVVMDGTAKTPSEYSGRLGFPNGTEVGHISVLRIPTCQGSDATAAHTAYLVPPAAAAQAYRRWTQGHYAVPAGDATLRSELTPTTLLLPDDSACGLLEDTRQAKRLLTEDGELRSAHLSDFAYRNPACGAALLQSALPLAAKHGNPALFVAVPASDTDAFLAHLDIPQTVVAPATIYGTRLAAAPRWTVNTAEI
ncbi:MULTISPECIES: GNAT family N-acetyltransferase [Mycobacterium ulcerans group]|nr:MULTISPECIES: GNAT family N-acetyltransferase [Mycobacterium ulcerans group]MDC8971225.1 GNAT family N-acetyltransferase [Mycobacterium marinum]MDC8981560.1 GNAT family N-acetyltransferase [Mycobacterium marinum]MDC8998581.1 GNAT family N-acetyltransferase [Mycobacterium marinum]MDC9009093.1 GNAT family N-acetyltransferase [Mycobacterium marinum]MDC9015278.1 GNAT family N-acetyltransferase [Mycobacterium marinum]